MRQILSYPVHLGKVVATTKLANAIGVRVIAEMVEDDATVTILRRLKVDFAQGFGISTPQLLSDLSRPAAVPAARFHPAATTLRATP